MLILIAGPYRAGTGDDPAKMAANLAQHVLMKLRLHLSNPGRRHRSECRRPGRVATGTLKA